MMSHDPPPPNPYAEPPMPPAPDAFNLALAVLAAVIAAAVSAALCYVLTVHARIGQAVPVLAAGPLVGLAVRVVARRRDPTVGLIACVLAAAGAVAGFIWADYFIWTPFMFGQTIRRILSLPGIIVFGVTIYLAYRIATPGTART